MYILHEIAVINSLEIVFHTKPHIILSVVCQNNAQVYS